jgi:hypothetical protein
VCVCVCVAGDRMMMCFVIVDALALWRPRFLNFKKDTIFPNSNRIPQRSFGLLYK